jgi:hypothetical protein
MARAPCYVDGKSLTRRFCDDAVAAPRKRIADFLHSIAGFADRVAARLQAKADETKAGEQAAEAAAADPVPVVEAPPVDPQGAVTEDPACRAARRQKASGDANA